MNTNSAPQKPLESPPMGIPAEHVRPCQGPRRNSCEAHHGIIRSTHLAPLNECCIAHDDQTPPMGIDPAHVRPNKGPRRDSCEGRPGIIQSTHLAPLNEGLMAQAFEAPTLEDDQMANLV